MYNLRFGVPRLEPFVEVSDQNSLDGNFAPFILARDYYLVAKFNITFIDIGPRIPSTCDETGLCTGSLSFLQQGLIDYSDMFAQSQFPVMPDNITIGPVLREDECRLFYKPKVRTNIIDKDFFDFTAKLDRTTHLVLAFLTFTFAIFSILICKKSKYVLPSGLWILYRCLLGKDFPDKLKPRAVILACSIFLFFTLLIISVSLQTGLIASNDFTRIDTLFDILKHGYKPAVVKVLSCRHTIESSTKPINIMIAARMDLLDPQGLSPSEMTFMFFKEKRVLIDNSSFNWRLKGMSCMMNQEEEYKNPTYMSKDPVASLINHFVLTGLHTNRIIRKMSFQAAYNAFEAGNIANAPLQRLDLKGLFVENLDGQCMTTIKQEAQIILTSLSFRYFAQGFWIVGLGFIAAYTIFLFEFLFGRVVR